VGVTAALGALPPPRESEWIGTSQGERALLEALAGRLRLWCRQLEGRQGAWPPVPAIPLAPPPAWLAIENQFSHPDLNALPPRHLERLAARLTLCRQARQVIEMAETGWAALRPGASSPQHPTPSSRLTALRSPSAG
jgi:hypothetical protein